MPTAKKSPAKKPVKSVAKPATPAAKKAGKRTLADCLATVAIPAGAWGLSRVQSGVGVTPHVDQMLALGFPHMVCVVDEPWTVTDAKKAMRTFDLSRVVPREMLLRLFAHKSTYDATKRDAAFAADPKPFELASVIDDEIAANSWDRIWILEAMFGCGPVAEAFVDALATAPANRWERGLVGNGAILGLGSVLDRAPAAARERLRGRLDALFDGLHETLGERLISQSSGQALDLILHGREGVERSGKNSDGTYDTVHLHWARDDPAWLEREVLASALRWKGRDRNWFDAQLAFAGGPKVRAALRTSLANGGVHSAQRKAVEAQLALFA